MLAIQFFKHLCMLGLFIIEFRGKDINVDMAEVVVVKVFHGYPATMSILWPRQFYGNEIWA